MAAWRAGAPLTPSDRYYPVDILKIPGAREYSKGKDALLRLKELGGRGLLIVVQNPNVDWKDYPTGGNYATYWGTYWEYCNVGVMMDPSARRIIHSRRLPDIPVRTIIVVPLSQSKG